MTDHLAGIPERISIEQFGPEQARANFHLVLLANPNFFGTIENSAYEPVLAIAGDTAYEQLGCVGFCPALSRLEAVVSIGQVCGYNGDLCTPGSQEYVRFYLSFDGGATWQDQGAVSFTVHDLPGPKPLEYSVALPVTVPEYFCAVENLPLVRAILSWNYEPPAATPGFVPVWGNVVNGTIQVPAAGFILLGSMLADAEVTLPAKLAALVDTTQPLATLPPKALTPQQLVEIYEGTPVQPHRVHYKQITAVSKSYASSANVALGAAQNPLAKLGLDLGALIGDILATSGNTSYERLGCVGLDLNRSALAATVQVRQPYGYGGGLCTTGSTEYVAFWVDWGTGFEYAGTTSFTTHDIAQAPATGLDYAVTLPVDLASHRQPCADGPQIATVRAILSWEVAPPPTDPGYVPAWGNQVDALVQIPAGETFVAGTPDIAIVGGIGIAAIDTAGVTANPGMTLPNALFALTGSNADPWIASRQCAFGGEVVVQGLPSIGSKYRVWVQKIGAPLPVLVANPVLTTNYLGNSIWVSPDGSGFFTYLDPSQNIDNNLAYWYSSGDDLHFLWLEIADTSNTVFGSTPLYLIQLDNTAPAAAIHIDNGGDCKQFGLASTIDGHFVATDLHFGAFSLQTTPASLIPPPNEPTTATPSTSPTAAAPGDAWSLDTTGMISCGYVIQLWVYDNTIVGSGPNGHNTGYSDVGFCLIQQN